MAVSRAEVPEEENEFSEVHGSIVSGFGGRGILSSVLKGSVSRHVLSSCVSFSELNGLHSSLKSVDSKLDLCDYVSSCGEDVVVSVKISHGHRSSNGGSKKRCRAEDADDCSVEVERKISQLRSSLTSGSACDRDLEVARSIIARFLSTVRGSGNEIVVQSWGVFLKTVDSASSSVVIAFRLHAGVAISLSAIKKALGSAWVDGVLTTNEEAPGISGLDVPYTSEGSASLEFGNRSLLLVTKVPAEKKKPN